MKRYAFIDVQNTASTAQNMLGFVIDWAKLADYLKNKKSARKYSSTPASRTATSKPLTNLMRYRKYLVVR